MKYQEDKTCWMTTVLVIYWIRSFNQSSNLGFNFGKNLSFFSPFSFPFQSSSFFSLFFSITPRKPIFGILNARPFAQPLYSPSSCLKNCEPDHMVRGKVLLNKSRYMDKTLAQQISPSHPIWLDLPFLKQYIIKRL
jgi:hypothetical protein